ncbi:GNAT family N-acetyltransferase [Actinospongicola halichondriae]|uniref:GNAT family N-acetyltransferase n=1 Tax=Actinospongicola halichondriae TaxID=3236844 RepID=UPI003D4FC8E7
MERDATDAGADPKSGRRHGVLWCTIVRMADVTGLRLRPLRLDDEAVCVAAHAELAVDRFPFLLDHRPSEPWAEFVSRLDRHRRGIDLPPDRVPAALLLAEVDKTVVGRASVRFELNEYLAAYAGHVGYGVLAAHRGRGHATEILRQSLIIARSEGVGRVLVTCDHDNDASAAVIERNGGVFESCVDDPTDGIAKRRFWID